MTDSDPTVAPQDEVVLRDATSADTAVLDTFNTYEVRTKHDFYDPEDLADGHRGASKWGSRVISDGEGRLLGRVTFHQVAYGPNRRSLAWRIGVTVLPEHRMRGVGARAQRLLADELFATTDAFRVEADTDVANTAERRALLAAGFREEGVIRGARWRAGARRDAVMFSRLRSDA
jgi:RimJ/RimL family protein N-acetyltransferase